MVIGWDIGGVNTKVARADARAVRAVHMRPYELQRAPGQLPEVLRALAAEAGAGAAAFECGVTMTAELSQMFRTKREGVAFVLDAVEAAFPGSAVHVFTVHGTFVTPAAARRAPLDAAAANWAAAAHLVATRHPDAVLVDIGTTTADIIPIVGGRVSPEGRTDPERLASGELVYTGVVRTPAEAIASVVPLAGAAAGVSAEGFALAGDVHLWRGDLNPEDYTWPTPDRRPATRAFAAERLARVVCADRELLDDAAIAAIADALAAAQAERIAGAMRRVLARHPSIRGAVVTGIGTFLGERASRDAGLEVTPLAAGLGAAAARCAPAACVALLLERALREGTSAGTPHRGTKAPGNVSGSVLAGSGSGSAVPTDLTCVVKVGGGLLAHAERLAAVLAALARTARSQPLLIVPGGGPFADAVREVDARLGLPDDAAHWMAILAMDQYAHLLASRLPGGTVVEGPDAVRRAVAAGQLPVLAPSRWLRGADPLPHTWEVTGDSIAAWVAGQIGARELVLIKPPHAEGDSIVDGHFRRALPEGVEAAIVSADRLDLWDARPHGRSTAGRAEPR